MARQALALIDADPSGAVSMRQLADALGVGVMTIYGYVRNKEELYEAVCELAFSERPAQAVAAGPWHERVRETVGELYTLCRRHPNLVSIALTDTTFRPSLFTRRARILEALEGAGFPQPVALRALGTLISFTVGFAVSGNSALRELPDDATTWAELPRLAGTGEDYAHHLDDDAFAYGVELLIAGLREDLRRYSR